MFIWQGLGFLVFLIAILAFALTQFVVNAVAGDPNYYTAHPSAQLGGGVLAATLVFGFSSLLERRPGRLVEDVATGEQFELKPKHSLFFVPVKYWPYLLLVLTVVLTFTRAPSE